MIPPQGDYHAVAARDLADVDISAVRIEQDR